MDLLLASFNLVSTVDFPTRLHSNSATAIDNIFIDVSLQGNYVVYPLCNGFSDDDAQLIALTERRSFIRNMGKKEKRKIRSIDQVAVQDFQYKLSFETCDSVFSTSDINRMYNSFFN
jgi:hypothetical protein